MSEKKEKDRMIPEPFASRLQQFRNMLGEHSLDAFLVVSPENRHYLSGYEAEDVQLTESSGYLLITGTRQFLLTDPRYEQAAMQEAPGYELVVYNQGVAQVLPDLFLASRITRLGGEGDYLTFNRFGEIGELLKKSNPRSILIATEGLIEQLRIVKEPVEIDRIKASLALTEAALKAVWERLRPGMTEKSVAWDIERIIREGGGQAVSFPPIAASGPNAALPHAVPTDRKIEDGEPLILDLGSKLDHYCSDMTRTWVAGSFSAKMEEVYRVVREAQLAAQDALRAGIDSVEIDGVARNLIARAGYGEYFGHGLGHGVGLAIHEKPGVRKHSGTILEENMVITIEPGIYLPGIGGVRLENMARVTATGCEILNREGLFFE
jgi:Xaa-Pro aminopeptidase